jgi:hypothetical protein
MTEPDDPNDKQDTTNVGDADSLPLERRPRFVSSRPPHSNTEWPLVRRIRGLTACNHPKEAYSPAILVEENGSRISMCWCGGCGSIRLPNDPAVDWLRPGYAQALADDDVLSNLMADVRALAEASTVLTKAARAAKGLGEWPRAQDPDLSSRILVFEDACVELERTARSVLRKAGA